MRRSLWLAAIAIAALLCSTFPAAAAGPPLTLAHYLTKNGKLIWNVDALVSETIGDRTPCWDSKDYNIFAVARGAECPDVPYVVTFVDAHGSAFRLVARSTPPIMGATSSAIRINGRYVSCPNPVFPGPGWVVFGGEELGDGLLWCS
jgi:hypothetical protein